MINFSDVIAQDKSPGYRNRICSGLGGEDGYLGIDYSRDIYKSKLFLGVGCGIGTGWTAYLRYEPVNWYGLSPFLSAGISHTFVGTLILSPGSSIFSASGGLNYLPKLRWTVIPVISIGATYYSNISGPIEGGMNGLGLLLKIGAAFPGRLAKSL